MPVRVAEPGDLAAVVALIEHEDAVMDPSEVHIGDAHRRAFAAIASDPRNELLVLEDEELGVVGCLHLTRIPGLGHGGAERAQLEAVRVRPDLRGRGLGRHLVTAAIARARDQGCTLVQLTSNKRRADAHRFYTSLGFDRSHEGFKLDLTRTDAPA
ncbi:GNAT family N-acetyltransferase [Actinomadura macrotermitis]|uniref:Aminoalkylphosphonate N-acetyltransferase n=1 Tax=Actinomadura macrotermitis TaxID=2585200 RepID=A0A7K0BP79_9ACTN|nr:GNAT family N-acetyltransferase [Actinomadura macrotermitis]MQY02662.1 Aminoalkylphosphonate N-acetyltransferase [Actinomadura macrotermitis]